VEGRVSGSLELELVEVMSKVKLDETGGETEDFGRELAVVELVGVEMEGGAWSEMSVV